MKALFDTNILIDYLSGNTSAQKEFKRYQEKFISIVTRMEVLIGAASPEEERQLEKFLNSFREVVLDSEVATLAVSLRRNHKIKLPDAIIWASAIHSESLFVTRNTKDFPKSDPGVRFPYKH